MVRFFEPRPFTPYYSLTPPFDSFTGGNITTARNYHICAPCRLMGIEFYNSITGSPTIRAGVWFNGSCIVYVDVPSCPVGIIRAEFDHHLTWNDLAGQRSLATMYQAAIWETSGTSYHVGNPTARKILASDGGMLGKCLYSCGTQNWGSPGWSEPVFTAGGRQPLDLLVVPDDSPDAFAQTPFPYFYGALHPTITLAAGGLTVGGQLHVKDIGVTIAGIRFYTHDTNAVTMKGTLWGPGAYPIRATGTVNCTGRGVYDCMFTVPYISTPSDLMAQYNNSRYAFGVYNQTSAFYTHTGTEEIITYLYSGWHTNEIQPAAQAGPGYMPYYYYSGDGRPNTNYSGYFGAELLVMEAP